MHCSESCKVIDRSTSDFPPPYSVICRVGRLLTRELWAGMAKNVPLSHSPVQIVVFGLAVERGIESWDDFYLYQPLLGVFAK